MGKFKSQRTLHTFSEDSSETQDGRAYQKLEKLSFQKKGEASESALVRRNTSRRLVARASTRSFREASPTKSTKVKPRVSSPSVEEPSPSSEKEDGGETKQVAKMKRPVYWDDLPVLARNEILSECSNDLKDAIDDYIARMRQDDGERDEDQEKSMENDSEKEGRRVQQEDAVDSQDLEHGKREPRDAVVSTFQNQSHHSELLELISGTASGIGKVHGRWHRTISTWKSADRFKVDVAMESWDCLRHRLLAIEVDQDDAGMDSAFMYVAPNILRDLIRSSDSEIRSMISTKLFKVSRATLLVHLVRTWGLFLPP